MYDHRAIWVRLREMARQLFPDDPLAAEIAAREAFDAEESAAYAANLDAQVDSGASLTTTIGCTAKYCRNFRDVVNTLFHEKGIK
jgi:hypothetical protein